MSNSEFHQEIIDYWKKKVHDDLKFWYGAADQKSTGIIALNGVLLGFVTISTFINQHDTASTLHTWLKPVLVGFIASVLISVIVAIRALRARIYERQTNSLPPIFFHHIAKAYPTDKNDISEQGINYFDKEMSKIKSEEFLLKSLASEITILSSNLKSKYVWIDRAYLCTLASILLMAGFLLF